MLSRPYYYLNFDSILTLRALFLSKIIENRLVKDSLNLFGCEDSKDRQYWRFFDSPQSLTNSM